MNYREVLSCLQAYADDEVPAGPMRKMEGHFGSCPTCRGQQLVAAMAPFHLASDLFGTHSRKG